MIYLRTFTCSFFRDKALEMFDHAYNSYMVCVISLALLASNKYLIENNFYVLGYRVLCKLVGPTKLLWTV